MYIDDHFIINYFFVNNKINVNKIKHYNHIDDKINLDIYNYLINRYDDNPEIISFTEILNRIKYHIEIRPICKTCGNPVKFIGNKNKGLYTEFCCVKCSNINKEKILKERKTKKQKYGDENYNNRQKYHDTCLKKYGKYTYTNREKAKQTCLELYGYETPFHSEKIQEIIKQTIKIKYNVDNISQLDWVKKLKEQTCFKKYRKYFYTQTKEFKEKSKQTCFKKYRKYFYTQTKEFKEKSKQTCLNKYGVCFYTQTKEYLEKSKQIKLKRYGNENYNNRNKYIQTCLNLYGIKNTFQLPYSINNKLISCSTSEYHNKLSTILSSKEVQMKIYNSKKKNGTYAKSKEEDQSYELLKEKYPDVLRQYRSDRYPFNCDFYIPSLDLYIECNYFWTHGGKLYEGTKQDNILLQHWKNQNTQYYDNAIKNWTCSDIKKYNTAKENNLNYLIFYNINQLKCFLKGEFF